MAAAKPNRKTAVRKKRLTETIAALTALQFGPKQRNETAAYTLLALLDLQADVPWSDAQAPLCGITPIIDFIAITYGKRFAPNTRETIRDDAVKFFVEEGLLLRNPDNPDRPTNSGKTVYQIEPTALALFRKFGSPAWTPALRRYLASRESLKHEIARKRDLARVPVTLPDGSQVALSPGGQNPLIKAIIEHFCPAFAPGGVVLYIGIPKTSSSIWKPQAWPRSASPWIPPPRFPTSSSTTPSETGSCSSKPSPVPARGRQAPQGTQRPVRRLQSRARVRHRFRESPHHADLRLTHRLGIRSLDRRRPRPHDSLQRRAVSWAVS